MAAVSSVVCLVALLLAAGDARAAISYTGTSLGPCGISCGTFRLPQDVAVDQANGDIYVTDEASKHVYRFDSKGNPKAFAATGTNSLTCPVQSGCEFDPGYSSVAVDPSAGPTAGDILVTDNDYHRVWIFGPEGEPRGKLAWDFEKGPAVIGVAVDARGVVYVSVRGIPSPSQVEEFVPKGGEDAVTEADRVAPIPQPKAPGAMAVDSKNDLWVAPQASSPARKFDTSGDQLAKADSGYLYGAGVDQVDDHLFLVRNTSYAYGHGHLLDEFDPEGTLVNSITLRGEGYGVAAFGSNVYVANGEAGVVDIYEAKPSLPPVIQSVSSADVTATSIDLRAQVVTHDLVTSYHFDYIADRMFRANAEAGVDPFTGAGTAPVSGEAQLEGSETTQTAVQHVQGLTPGETYHYRAVASNGVGAPVVGVEATFTTEPSLTSSTLPDARAYELVSPAEKNGADIEDQYEEAQAAADGDSIVYMSLGAFGEPEAAPIHVNYIAVRNQQSGGWETHGIDPAQAPTSETQSLEHPRFAEFTADLGAALFLTPNAISGAGPAEPQRNLYLRDRSGGWQLLTAAPNSITSEVDPAVGGMSADGRSVAFEFHGKLTPDATAGERNLYYWSEGQAHLVNVFPDGEVDHLGTGAVGQDQGGFAAGAQKAFWPFAGANPANAVSRDGSRVYWTGTDGNLYLRESPDRPQSPVGVGGECEDPADACTVRIDASVGGGGVFQAATPDGSIAIFTKDGSIYRYEVSSAKTTLLAADAVGGNASRVIGMTEDGAEVYFTSQLALAGADANPRGGVPKTETRLTNIYAARYSEAGVRLAFVGGEALDETERSIIAPGADALVFSSVASLTGFDNEQAGPGECASTDGRCAEVFMYSTETAQLDCLSCNPWGSLPIGPASIRQAGSDQFEPYVPRFVADGDRRVFFQSRDVLAAGDTNQASDVYEWEQGGEGSCPADRAQGCTALISDGRAPGGSFFVDASASGDDVFITTRDRLVPADVDESSDLYDARVGGGFAPAPSQPACPSDDCQPAPLPLVDFTPASAVFSGAGNMVQPLGPGSSSAPTKRARCAKGWRASRGRCVKVEVKRRRRHRARAGRAGTRATRGGGR